MNELSTGFRKFIPGITPGKIELTWMSDIF